MDWRSCRVPGPDVQLGLGILRLSDHVLRAGSPWGGGEGDAARDVAAGHSGAEDAGVGVAMSLVVGCAKTIVSYREK